MAMQNHLGELERRHQALEREIQDALCHPSTDSLRTAELKRRKLQLKDEITNCARPIAWCTDPDLVTVPSRRLRKERRLCIWGASQSRNSRTSISPPN